MQVNGTQAQLISLHSAYNSCLKNRMGEWLAMEPAQKSEAFARGEVEFCQAEKKNYLNFMEKNVPVEYKNIMRLEQGNY